MRERNRTRESGSGSSGEAEGSAVGEVKGNVPGNRLAAFFHDMALSILVGGMIALTIFVLFFAAGLGMNGFDAGKALNMPRSALFIVGALLMLISAGMLIRSPDEKRLKGYRKWKERYRIFGLFHAFFTVSVTILAAACVLDYFLYNR